MVRPQLSESKVAARLEQSMRPNIPYENGDNNSSSERIDGRQLSINDEPSVFVDFESLTSTLFLFENFTDDVSDKSSAFGSRHDLSRVETPLPDWVIVGESVLVRPYSYSGVIAYVGPTEFASGTWIGVELDAPTGKPRFSVFLFPFFFFLIGKLYILDCWFSAWPFAGKNDGAVNGHRYFTCRPKCGIFVKVDKLIQDKRGRALRNYTVSAPAPAPMRRSVSRGSNNT